jgi:hypothetical protein
MFVLGPARALNIATTNRITLPLTLLTNLSVLFAYWNTHGEMNIQTARTQLIPLIHWVRFKSAMLKRTTAQIADPTIQLFQDVGNRYAPYTQGDTKNHIPASNAIELADLLALGYPLKPL